MFSRRNQLWWLIILGIVLYYIKSKALKRDIQKRGIRQPLLVLSDGTILNGWKRYKIARQLGYNCVPVVILNNEVEQCSVDAINSGG